MASVALSAAGYAVGGPVGSAVGAMIGAYIDQRFLFPMIFGRGDTITGPRIDEIQLQTASLGAKLAFCMGPTVRTAGTVIYISDLKPTIVQTDDGGGGCGGGGPPTEAQEIRVDVAVAVCEGPIVRIHKIWADAKLIYDFGNGISLAGSDVTVTREEEGYWYPPWQPPENWIWITRNTRMKLSAPNGGTNLSSLVTGRPVTLAGFSNGANNGAFLVTETFEEDDGTEVAYCENNDCITEAAGASVTLITTIPDRDVEKIGDINLYRGTHTQSPDPILETIKGAGEVPAFVGTAYIVMEDFLLTAFGNRMPQLSFEVEADTTLTIAEGIEKILDRAQLSSSQYDTSELTGSIQGYRVMGPVSGATQLQPLMFAYDIVARENETALDFFHRESEPEVTVALDDLAAHSSGAAFPEQILFGDVDTRDIARNVTVKFLNTKRDHQTDDANYARIDYVDGENELVLDLTSLTFEGSGIPKKIAKRTLFQGFEERFSGSLSLPPSYWHLLEGDVIDAIEGSSGFKMLVSERDRGANGLIETRGILRTTRELDFQDDEDGDDPDDLGGSVYSPPHMTALILDLPALTDGEVTTPGYYFAACASDFDATFQGAGLYDSLDDADFTLRRDVPTEAVLVRADTVLADGVIDYWDRTNTVDVTVLHGTLSSAASELAVLNGTNRLLLGTEIIGFQTATLIGTNQYRLSKLIRGRRNTHLMTTGHTLNEMGALLTIGPVGFVELALGACGLTRYVRCLSAGQTIADVNSISQEVQCGTLRPFAPSHISASRAQDGAITYSWIRVTRSTARILAETLVPLIPPTEKYEIDIYGTTDGSWGGSVLRTITVTGAASTAYSIADQATDGLTLHTKYDVRIYQLDDSTIGRGVVAQGTL